MKAILKVLVFIACALFSFACGPSDLRELSDKDEISIKFQHVAQFGETKKYLTHIESVPKIPSLPNGYELFQNKVYYLRTETIDLGDPIVSFKISTDSEEVFRNVRILQPVFNELAPNDFEWRDCTIAEDNVWQVPPYNKEEAGEYLQDFETRKINCMINDGLHPEEYFAVVLQSQPPPTRPFTDLSFDYRVNERRSSSKVASYELTIKNLGQKDIGDLNIHSNTNSELLSIDPDRGKCRWLPIHGSGDAVCYLGELPVGQKVTINVDISLTSPFLGENHLAWGVDAIIKENRSDPLWPANYFTFYPL